MERPTSVLLVDDHVAFAQALELAIGLTHDLRCVACVPSLSAALAWLGEQAPVVPDVVVLDLGLPDVRGVDGLVRLRQEHPSTRVLVLTGQVDDAALERSVASGAAGFLRKDVPLSTVLDALRHLPDEAVVVGRQALLRAVPAAPPGADRSPDRRRDDLLTPREVDVVRLLATGVSSRAIASQLTISLSTCRGYVKSLLSKLGAHSQLEAVSVARSRGIID